MFVGLVLGGLTLNLCWPIVADRSGYDQFLDVERQGKWGFRKKVRGIFVGEGKARADTDRQREKREDR